MTSMLRTGLETPVVWIDVEPVPDFEWSADTEANAAVVRGLARGYRAAGYRIGVYSTPLLWEGVVGDLSLGVPEWRAAGPDVDGRGARPVRCGLGDPGRAGRPGAMGGGQPRPQRDLPGHGRRDGPVVPPATERSVTMC